MDDRAYQFLEQQQFSHWWFRGRARLIAAVMRRTLGTGSAEKEILDIGSGYGALIPVLRSFGQVDAIESYQSAHEALKDLGIRTVFSEPFPQNCPSYRYDIVTMFDVLEHLDNDEEAVRTIHVQLLKKHGHFFLTVPAYQWLWSKHDENHGHRRRYTRTQVKHLFLKAGFRDIRVSYFMTFLFPLALAQRLIQKISGKADPNDLPHPSLINRALEAIFSFESLIIPWATLPFGLSIIAHGKK